MGAAGRHLWIDASAGIAGDMLLGALIDAGAPLAAVQDSVDAVLPGAVRLSATEARPFGQRSTRVSVAPLIADQPYRRWPDIQALVLGSGLDPVVGSAALRVFEVLAAAEGRVHGKDPTEVHFHEVGAWDSIADVVGVCAALQLLGVTSVSAGSVAVGSGRVAGAHGDLPVPVPAVLELGIGWELLAGGSGELATPTGLALVRGLATTCEVMPPMRVTAAGVGAGAKDPPGRANVVRVVIGEPTTGPAEPGAETLWVLETNVDDLDPRVWPTVLAGLLEAGAADAWLTAILMKKGRPGHTLSVLCHGADRARLRGLTHSLTSTFGTRAYPVDRVALQWDWRRVDVRGESVRIKVSIDDEGRILHATPEFEDADAAARSTGVPVRQLLAEAATAASAGGLRVGAVLSAVGS